MKIQLKKLLLSAALSLIAVSSFAQEEINPNIEDSSTKAAWYDVAWTHAKDTWNDGTLDLYIPAYTWHLPWAYSDAKIASLNSYPAGAGLGVSRFNSSGNFEGIYAMAFADSHNQPQYGIGYQWVPTWHPFDNDFRVGAGASVFITARADIGHYTPFPGILPVGTIGYKNVDLQATYIPGGGGFGNVAFVWAKIKFD